MTIWSLIVLPFAVVTIINCQSNNVMPLVKSCNDNPCSCCLETVTCPADRNCGSQCKDGYFGGKCLTSCPNNCIRCKDPYNPTGDQSLWGVANCTECKPGYFSTQQSFQCQLSWPENCVLGTSSLHCEKCADGYFRNTQNTCTKCKDGCAICSSATSSCQQCQIGHYGEACLPCSGGCDGGRCNNVTGSCSCKSGFSGDKCDTCLNGHYKHGSECMRCSVGCASCTSLKNCTSCLQGHHGNTCSRTCPSVCAGKTCDRLSGACTRCNDGFFGSDCTSTCPTHCLGGSCHQMTGSCTAGCTSGYSGDRCCHEGRYCDVCSEDGHCLTCKAGMYGSLCNDVCPENCAKRVCSKNTGVCIACPFGFSGATCSEVVGPNKNHVTGLMIAVIVLSIITVALLMAVAGCIIRRCRDGRVRTTDVKTPVLTPNDRTVPTEFDVPALPTSCASGSHKYTNMGRQTEDMTSTEGTAIDDNPTGSWSGRSIIPVSGSSGRMRTFTDNVSYSTKDDKSMQPHLYESLRPQSETENLYLEIDA